MVAVSTQEFHLPIPVLDDIHCGLLLVENLLTVKFRKRSTADAVALLAPMAISSNAMSRYLHGSMLTSCSPRGLHRLVGRSKARPKSGSGARSCKGLSPFVL